MAIHIVDDKLEAGLQGLAAAQGVPVAKTRMAIAVLQAAVDEYAATGDPRRWMRARVSSDGEPAGRGSRAVAMTDATPGTRAPESGSGRTDDRPADGPASDT